jgi:uridine kinase
MVHVVFVFIGGASASGKTSFAKALHSKILEQGRTAHVISMDNYYRELPEGIDLRSYRRQTNFDIPEMLHLDELKKHLLCLQEKQPCATPTFDFSTLHRASPNLLNPAEVIIIEGIFALYFLRTYFAREELNSLTVNVDLSSYLSIIQRRVERNATLHHQSQAQVMRQERNSVGPGFFKFTAPGAIGADFSILNDNSRNANGTINTHFWEDALNNIFIELLHRQVSPHTNISKPDVQELVMASHRRASIAHSTVEEEIKLQFHGLF